MMDNGELFRTDFTVRVCKGGSFAVVLKNDLTRESAQWAFSDINDLAHFLSQHATAYRLQEQNKKGQPSDKVLPTADEVRRHQDSFDQSHGLHGLKGVSP